MGVDDPLDDREREPDNRIDVAGYAIELPDVGGNRIETLHVTDRAADDGDPTVE